MDPPSDDGSAAGGHAQLQQIVRTCEATLRHAYMAGQRLWGDLRLSFAAYAEASVAAILRRPAVGPGDRGAMVMRELGRRAMADLFLAIACAEGLPAACEQLTRSFRPRLRGLAQRRGFGAGGDELIQDLLADLLVPALGSTRRGIASYDGTGSLFGWLSTILLRNVADRCRIQKRDAAITADDDTAASAAVASDPLDGAIAVETTAVLRDEVQSAWGELGRQERLVLLFRFRNGLAQTRIATVLGVSESRVSRILARAVNKLRGALRSRLESNDIRGGPPWQILRDLIGERLQESDSRTDLPATRSRTHEQA